MQEGGDVTFLAAVYQALLADAQPTSTSGGSQPDQKVDGKDAGTINQAEGLEAAVNGIKQLFLDYCRFSTGATAAVQRNLPELEKLLRSDAASACSSQAAVDFMAHAL